MTRKLVYLTVLALAISLALVAADSAFVGTWKLNVAKSKFSPGPGPKSFTVTIPPDGKVAIEEVDAAGKPMSWSYTPNADAPAPITGLPDSSVIEKRIGDRNVEHTWKMSGGSMAGHGVLSKDGKTMTYTLTGKNANGEPVHNVELFERQ